MLFSNKTEVKLDPVNKKKLLNYAMPLGFFTIGFILIFFVGVPKLNSFSELSKSKKESEEALRMLSIKVNTLKTSLKPYEQAINQNYDKVNHALPSESDVPGLMTEIEHIASSSGLTIESLQFASDTSKKPATTPVEPDALGEDGEAGDSVPVVKPSTLEQVSVQAVFSGKYTDIQLFLSKLENASRIVLADSFRFTPDRGSEGLDEDRLLCNISLVSFYLPDNAVLDLSAPLNFSLTSPGVELMLEKINNLDFYQVSPSITSVGKQNPFEQ